MKLSSVLSSGQIVVPLEAEDLPQAIQALVVRLEAEERIETGSGGWLSEALAAREIGEVIRVNESILFLVAQTEVVEDLALSLGIASSPFTVDEEGEEEASAAQALFLLLTPRRVSTLKVQVLPTLSRILRDGERTARLLRASTPSAVLALKELMDADLMDQLLVCDGLTPLRYRVYPDTPIREVVDLMIRRELHDVPVVGEKYEFLGVITAADVLKHLLPGRLSGESRRIGGIQEEETLTAREAMNRSVMCISDDLSMMEAAKSMVNKGVNRLPVVREGELLGFFTLDTALQALFGR
ncbi:MAG: CBS domain-containing protein [Gemmatimonadetes bacterium]|nr:CBS domain-containing protein [Gemmatimonadota bacterium]